MASSSLTVYGKDYKELRIYGGNRGHVRGMKLRYEKMTQEEFLKQHYLADEEDYKHMKLSTRFNKR